ncbi:MAG: hypothetical protein ABIJ61_04415, partial [bacterium]
MRPILTLILIGVALAVILYLALRPQPENPRVVQFIDCYVDLAIMQEAADSVSAVFQQARDSVLAAHSFDMESFLALKDSLDQTPEYLVEVWSE